jgi:tRNA_anti-like
MKLNIILVVGISLLSSCMLACSTAATANKFVGANTNAANNPVNANTDISSKTTASVNAPEFAKEFMENMDATRGKYLNKELIVSGKIKLVQKAVNAFYLETNTTKNLDAFICQFDGNMPSNLKEGQEVKVKGILMAASGTVDVYYVLKLQPCEIQ